MKQIGIRKKANNIIGKGTQFARNLSIYKRLILSFLIISIFPNLLIGYYSFNISSKEMEKKIYSSSTQALKSVEFNINDKLKLYEALSNQISKNEQIIDLIKKCSSLKKINNTDSKKKYEEYKIQIGKLLYQLSQTTDLSNVEIVTEDDEFRQYNYTSISVGASLINTDLYRTRTDYHRAIEVDGWPVWTDTSRENGIFRIEPVIRNVNLGNYLTLSNSMQDASIGKSLGVIIITVPTKIFSNMIDLQNMYDKNEVVFLTGKNGIVYILNGKYNFNIRDKSILNEIIQKQNGTFITTIENKQYILAFDSSGKADMVVAYMVERGKALNSVYRVRNIIIEVAVGCIFCAMLLAYFVTTSISKPLSRLKKTMERVEERGLEFEYKDNSKDEIGILGEKFNNMINSIKNLMETVINTELSRKNEEIRRKQAELDALQMQIKDHFIYNTLDLIRWNAMFVENENGPLSKMIEDFSSFLRLSTKKTNKLVGINEELEHLHSYLKVLRFKKEIKLQLMIDIKDQAVLQSRITKLTFQPIVENALKYGFENTEIEAVIIGISSYCSGNDLFIEIRDNGMGMTREQQNKLNEDLHNEDYVGGSIGLRNVNERIKLSFGREYGLKIESEEGKFTSVIIHIPNIKE